MHLSVGFAPRISCSINGNAKRLLIVEAGQLCGAKKCLLWYKHFPGPFSPVLETGHAALMIASVDL
jgi:hypothetical protein